MSKRQVAHFFPHIFFPSEHIDKVDNSPSQMRGIKFTNIRQSMLKLKTHSGFHDLF
jgi:hypothetical protein